MSIILLCSPGGGISDSYYASPMSARGAWQKYMGMPYSHLLFIALFFPCSCNYNLQMKCALVLYCWPGTREAVCKEKSPKTWERDWTLTLMRQNPNGQWLEWKAKEGGEIAYDGMGTGEQSLCIH